MSGAVLLLDGAVGTELTARGLHLPPPAWSALANRTHPELVRSIHRAYADAGAQVHTANTFRTRRRSVGPGWRALADLAVEHARAGGHPGQRVAGAIGPLEDCYRPDLSPADTYDEHAELADHLAARGVDLLLVETHPHPGEALAAVRAAVATTLPVWLALTPGPDGSLMGPQALAEAARRAVDLGVVAALVNCVRADLALVYVEALAASSLGVRFGVYANAGPADLGVGWGAVDGPSAYVAHARRWVDAGARIVGGCCGTSPDHVRALAAAFPVEDPARSS